MKNLWQYILSKLNQHSVVYLLTVLEHKGSSPGRQGFKMVISNNDEIYGSIGGGVMEFNLVELCKELLKKKDYKPFIKRQIHKGTIVDGSGMICSGEQTIAFYPITQNNLETIKNLIGIYSSNKSGVLSISPSNFSFSAEKDLNNKFKFTLISENEWSYEELINKKDIIYIIGAGHVGLATSKLMSDLGFYVILLDNREQLNTFEKNLKANEKRIIDYADVASHIPESNSAYIGIMTNKYTDDKLVLSKLLGKSYKYIGVLGSDSKLKLMMEVLEKEGLSVTELEKVHAPIGMTISSQTPQEIAVSIAAEIISIRNKQ
ncbi:MAG: XdhC family protein [Flavobacteriaceae bacterium]|nr:XdhC family protein [Flavobacteriaceae bacterium]